jgi:spore germination cell wall hydrolase CwlJ-like protein
MSMLKTGCGVALLALALAGGASAETDAGKSTISAQRTTDAMVALFGQEKTAMKAVSPERMAAIAAPSGSVSTPAPKKERAAAGIARAGAAGQGTAAPTYDGAWLSSHAAARSDAQFRCLATALYFEARGESIRGQAAVAEVILNRTELPSYPNSICGVVNQTGSGSCAFSYVCDGRSDAITDLGAWDRAKRVASAMLAGAPRLLTEGATHFHTPAVRPVWSRKFAHTATIGAHLFYRQPMRTAMN